MLYSFYFSQTCAVLISTLSVYMCVNVSLQNLVEQKAVLGEQDILSSAHALIAVRTLYQSWANKLIERVDPKYKVSRKTLCSRLLKGCYICCWTGTFGGNVCIMYSSTLIFVAQTFLAA